MAAVLACGPDAVLSHLAAAALWSIRQSDRIEVTTAPRTAGRAESSCTAPRSATTNEQLTEEYRPRRSQEHCSTSVL